MSDVAVRLAVVAGAVVLAVVVGLVLRQGRAWVRRPIRIPGLGRGVYLFTARTCPPCDRMRDRLRGIADVSEVAFEDGGFPDAIRRVPAVARLEADGTGWVAHGMVSRRRLERWLVGP